MSVITRRLGRALMRVAMVQQGLGTQIDSFKWKEGVETLTLYMKPRHNIVLSDKPLQLKLPSILNQCNDNFQINH